MFKNHQLHTKLIKNETKQNQILFMLGYIKL